MRCLKTIAATLTALSIAFCGAQTASAAGWINFDDYNNCTELTCDGSGGPAGETPGCKPPPYRPQTCEGAYLWLPTTIIYPAPETVVGSDPSASITASGIMTGNYVAVTINPIWVLLYEYHVLAESPYKVLVPPPSLGIKYSYPTNWSETRGKGNLMLPKDLPGTAKVTDNQILNRMWTGDFVLFHHSLNELVNNPSQYRFSYSPYAKTCFRAEPDAFDTLEDYRPVLQRNQRLQSNLAQFVNRSNSSTFTSFASSITSPKFLQSLLMALDDPQHLLYNNRPIYFLYAKYYISIHKGQASGRNGRCRN